MIPLFWILHKVIGLSVSLIARTLTYISIILSNLWVMQIFKNLVSLSSLQPPFETMTSTGHFAKIKSINFWKNFVLFQTIKTEWTLNSV